MRVQNQYLKPQNFFSYIKTLYEYCHLENSILCSLMVMLTKQFLHYGHAISNWQVVQFCIFSIWVKFLKKREGKNVGSLPLATIIAQLLQIWFNLLRNYHCPFVGLLEELKLIFKCLGWAFTWKMHLLLDQLTGIRFNVVWIVVNSWQDEIFDV